MEKFVKTTDKAIADKMKKSGYVLVNEVNNIFTFVNSGTLTFSDDEKKKVIYSNILCV